MKAIFVICLISIYCQSLLADSFKNGYYYTAEGRRVEGLIEFKRASISLFRDQPSRIIFKENRKAKRMTLSVNDISSFVIEKDSFALVYNIKINPQKGKYVKEFAKVVSVGKVNLYLEMGVVYSGKYRILINRFVLSKDNKKFIGIWNPKKQRSVLADFFSDNQAIQIRILNKEFDKDIPSLVEAYDQSSAP